MIGRMVRGALVGLLLLATGFPALALESFQKSTLSIETASGGRFRFDIELAETPAQQAQGLMYREALAADAGMLFSFAWKNDDGTWTMTTAELNGLTLTPPRDFSGEITLTVTGTSTESNGSQAVTPVTLTVVVTKTDE